MPSPKELLDAFRIEPKKSLGQNFLHDPNVLRRIVEAAELTPADTVLEIGAGTGTLTRELAAAAGHVVAVETDERLLPILAGQLAEYANVQIVHADILQTSLANLMDGAAYSAVANLPYYITSAIIRHLLDAQHKPRRLVLTVQQEVGDRIVAVPDDMSLLAVSVQFYGKAQIISRIGAAAFWPHPDVSSAVLRIDVYDQPLVAVPGEALFFRVVRAGFSQKRKQLKNSLSAGLNCSTVEAGQALDQAGIDPKRRAETLTLEEWAALSRAVAAAAEA